jgi:cellulose synthase/poly-beta-1,6-N-acetylglucosamine synthase-like glycosyltransferase
MPDFTAKVYFTAFMIFLAYFLVLTVYYLILGVFGIWETRRRYKENEEEDYRTIMRSRFTIPVSVIIPAHNEELWIMDSVKAVLNLNYPEFEVLIVDDGSTDRTLPLLDEMLDLRPIDRSYLSHYPDSSARDVFYSGKYRNVTVISRASGDKKAGAVNSGLNLAKYKYVCVIDADTILEPDILMKVMSHVQKNPEKVIGAGSYFGLLNGFRVGNGRIIERSFSYDPIIAYQNLEYMRSFIGNRLAWSSMNAIPTVSGGFGIWRRDILAMLGGYDRNYSSEDIVLTYRAQDYMLKHPELGYEIIVLPYFAGWTDGPSNIPALVMQRNRWQRVINEVVWEHRGKFFDPKCGAFGMVTMPYMMIYEVLGVFFEAASIGFVLLGWILGLLDLRVFLAFTVFMALTQWAVSLISVYACVKGQRIFPLKYVLYLFFLGMVELFWYRWIISYAKLAGTFDYFGKIRKYDQYVRERKN